MKTITIRLASPLQSYGNEASFAQRTSHDFPTKSAVIGMIAAALGYHRQDHRISRLAALPFAIRIDQRGKMLTDFQTVEWKKDKRKVTYRNYLQDASFIVAIGGQDTIIDEIKLALRRPHFQLYLGRRANVPAGVLKISEFEDENPVTVLKELPWQAAEWYQRQCKSRLVHVKVIEDSSLLSAETNQAQLVKDDVVSFNQMDRQHTFRAIESTWVELKNMYFQGKESEHDILTFL